MAIRSKDTIFAAALNRTGNTSESADGDLWLAMDANYDEIVRSAFEDGGGTYPFGRTRVPLTSRSGGTLGFDDAYAMPSDVIHVVQVFFNSYAASDLLEQWEIDGETNSLLVDADGREIEIEYVRAGAESTWSAHFAMGVQRRLEAVIKDVQEDGAESEAKDREADLEFMRAGVQGAKSRSPKKVWNRNGGRLIRARRGQR